MAKRKKPKKGAAARSGDYQIGRGKPPKHTQFKPGQSGNPAGRPKGLRNFETDLEEVLARQLRVKDGDGTRKTSTQKALLMILCAKAVRGDLRALKMLLERSERRNQKADASEAGQPLSADEEALFEAFKAELLAEAGLPPSQASDQSPPPADLIRRRKLRDE